MSMIFLHASVIIFALIASVRSGGSPEKANEKGKEIVPHKPQPHRPDRAAALNALYRARYHATSAAYAEDRAQRTDNQLHQALAIHNFQAHKANFKKEQEAFNLAWHGNKEGNTHPSSSSPSQLLHGQSTPKIKVEAKEVAKASLEKKRKELNIGGHSSVTPSKQLRIGGSAESNLVPGSHFSSHSRKVIAKKRLSNVEAGTVGATHPKPPRARQPKQASTTKMTSEATQTHTLPPQTQRSRKTTESPRSKKETTNSRMLPTMHNFVSQSILLYSIVLIIFTLFTVKCAERSSELTSMTRQKLPPTSPSKQESHPHKNIPKHTKESLADWAKTVPYQNPPSEHAQQMKRVTKAPLTRLDDGASAAQKFLQSQKYDHIHG